MLNLILTYVKEYRLIGFDNKVGALSDTFSEVEGGEIGSGYSMMAIFEIVLQQKSILIQLKIILQMKKLRISNFNISNPGDSVTSFYSYSSPFRFIPFDELR